VVFLEEVDGRPHLEMARPVIAAGKPLFIDKPLAGSLADCIEIFRLAKEKNVPCFSSSSTRFAAGFQAARSGNSAFGQIKSCSATSPMSIEPHHPDLFWYGVHGVEILFTVMGTGCKTVTRSNTANFDKVTGVWNDDRIGTFRGIRSGKSDYGGTVFGEKGISVLGKYSGYNPLLLKIVEFFDSGILPVKPEETIDIFAFMAAADESKMKGGIPVETEKMIEKAAKKAMKFNFG